MSYILSSLVVNAVAYWCAFAYAVMIAPPSWLR